MKITLSVLLIFCSLALSLESQAQEKTWEPAYTGSDPTLLYLPDAYATYWRYGWKRTPGDPTGFVIKGAFPDARYFSYNVYDDDTKTPSGSFTDFQVKPDNSGTNPFTGKTDPSHQKTTYTIYVIPEGTNFKAKNVLYFPDSLKNVSFFLRYYSAEKNIYGSRPLPVISMFNTRDKQILNAPPSTPVKISKQALKRYLVPLFKQLAHQFEENPKAVLAKIHHRERQQPLKLKELIAQQIVAEAFKYFNANGKLESYNMNPAGTYPNHDSFYLIMPVIRKNDDLLLVKFKAPEFPENSKEYSSSDVRYFSLSQGDEMTFNYSTMKDEDFKINDDGFIYAVIGNDEKAVKNKASALNINFIPWRVKEKMLLVYRHMLPNDSFQYGINSVPTLDESKPGKGQEGSAFIGDYAPVGSLIPKNEFLKYIKIPDIK